MDNNVRVRTYSWRVFLIKSSTAGPHLGEQVVQRRSVEQGRSLRMFLWAVFISFEFTDAVSPNWRLSLSGAMPISEIKPERRDTEGRLVS